MILKVGENPEIEPVQEKPEEAMFNGIERAVNSAADAIETSPEKLDLTRLKAAISAHDKKFE